MGSQHSKFLLQQQLPSEFRPVRGLPTVYESIINGTRIQKHQLQLTSQAQIKYEKEVFIFRRMNADKVISANYFENFTSENMCNSCYHVSFFTEYPAYQMSLELSMCPQRAFNLLIDCLKGFQLLFRKFGSFEISCENIFFDMYHQPKVWISSDLGRTCINRQFGCSQTEQSMIMRLFSMFERVTQKNKASQNYPNYSNYIKNFQITKSSKLQFHKIIEFMVEEAPFAFSSRNSEIMAKKQTDVKLCGLVKRFSKNSNKNQPLEHTFRKQNSSHVISLKSKSRNNSQYEKNGSENSRTNNGFQNLQISKVSKFKEHKGVQIRKSRRCNSQEDCFLERDKEAFDTPKNRNRQKKHQRNCSDYPHNESTEAMFDKQETVQKKSSVENINNSFQSPFNLSSLLVKSSKKFSKKEIHSIYGSESVVDGPLMSKRVISKHSISQPFQQATQKTLNLSGVVSGKLLQRKDKQRLGVPVVGVQSPPLSLFKKKVKINQQYLQPFPSNIHSSQTSDSQTCSVPKNHEWKDSLILQKLKTMKSIFEGQDIDQEIRRDLQFLDIL